MQRIADVEAGEADLDLLGDLGRVADQLELVADRVQHAAALQARRLLLVDEADRHRDGDLGVLGNAQEIDMQRPVGDRMELDVLGQGADGRAAGVDHHHRVHEVAGVQHLHQRLLLEVDGEGLFIVAVDDGGDAAFATQRTGGSLASPFARLGRQRKLFAHCMSPKCGFTKVPLTPPGMTMNGEARL